MIDLNYDVKLVTRAEWGARPPRSVTRLVSGKVTSHWEGPHMGVFAHSQCDDKVRSIQNFHLDTRGWSDIAYNGVACPHGSLYEGRGRGVRSAANGTNPGNDGAYAVCYLGGVDDVFTEAGKRAMKAGGDWLTFAGSARNSHRDWKATACPGDVIYNWTRAGQPIVWAGPDPTPTPVPKNSQEEEDDVYTLVKDPNAPEYWMLKGFKKFHIPDEAELRTWQWYLNTMQHQVNQFRATWGMPNIQIWVYAGVDTANPEWHYPIPLPMSASMLAAHETVTDTPF